MASLWHCNVGHARREVVDAVARQMDAELDEVVGALRTALS